MPRLPAVRLLQRCCSRPLTLLALIVGINFVVFLKHDALGAWSEMARPRSSPATFGAGNPQSTDMNTLLLTQKAHGVDDAQLNEKADDARKSGGQTDPEPLSDESLKEMLAGMRQRIQNNGDEHLFTDLRGRGEAKLREVAVKGAIFKEALDTWERLNYFTLNDTLYPRSDIASRIGSFESGANILEEHRQLLERLGSRLFPWRFPSSGDFSTVHTSYRGRGIVLTCGTPQARLLMLLIRSIRKLGCDLPIELLYLGEQDLSEKIRVEFTKFDNVVLKDLSLVVNHAAWEIRGFAIKPYAMLASSFREVIFIDADAFFLVNPKTLFETEEYTETGTLFFKDRTLYPKDTRSFLQAILPNTTERFRRENRLWTETSSHMMESGVVVMDKLKHYVPLMMAARLNGPDRQGQGVGDARIKGLYDYILGDKETFWLAFEMIGSSDYMFHPSPSGSMGKLKLEAKQTKSAEGKIEHSVCSSQIIHFDQHGKPTWFNGGLRTSKKTSGEIPWAEFDVYNREPDEPEKSGLSRLYNRDPKYVLCQRSHEYSHFTKQEQGVLNMLISLAKKDEDMLRKSELVQKENEPQSQKAALE